jgi:hypothetical protein
MDMALYDAGRFWVASSTIITVRLPKQKFFID